ncbi:hypothetical protein BGZ95_004083 [Linnemannia exigua]|uniref:Major facilitator superfamily (MFS) profile domain-containing protein n=1 Tax=Linnemannia exigua TaxID=604196 RepID=A0AAD4H207_9FUNG|nr:hypothetical protein BGZ95_004083 [Linnemannia exigua]
MTNQQQQQHIDPFNRSVITSSSAHGNETVNSSTTTLSNSNGTSTPTPIPTLQSSQRTSDDDRKTFEEVDHLKDHSLEKGDHRRESDPDSEEPLSRRGSFGDEVVMESGFRGYLVVFGGFLVILAFIGYVSIYGIFQSKYNEIYGARGQTASSISFVGSLASGFQFGFTIIAGPAMNRFGHKIILWLGCIIGSLGLLLASWCTELWQLYLTQGVMFGIGASFLNIAATAIPPLWYDKNRGLAMGICFCGAGVGGLILGFVIPALINAVDIYWTLRIFAIFHFVCTAFAAIVMRAPRQLSGPPVEVKREVMNWSILKDGGFILWILAAVLFGFAYVIPFAYVPSFAKDVVGLDSNVQGGQLLAIMSGANAIGRILIGIAGDRLGAIPVAAVSFIAAGASCFIWMFSTTHGALIGFSIVYGFFSGAFFTMIASITANIVGLNDLGSGLTIIYLVNTPGNLFTLPIAGRIFENAGNYKAMIGYNAAMYLAGGVVLFSLLAYHHCTKRVRPQTKKYIADLALFALSQAAFYYAFKYIISSMDPLKTKKKDAHEKSAKVLDRLGHRDIKLNEYEQVIASEVIHPEDIKVDFDQIGGLDPIIRSLRESVILPLNHPALFTSASGLLGAPKGVLLYGPPGCGKTMLAKALAKESGATFINMHVSTLTDKWFGESNKLVAALFSLAHKMQPAIIFIDEIDSFLRERRSNDHEITSMMKAEFMSMWDGLTTGEDTRIIVLGATNRPNDIDSAILRRMPKRFAIKLPSEEQRMNILKLMLAKTKIDPNFDFRKLVQKTAGFSGSDLKEACRNASMLPLREYLRGKGSDTKGALDGVVLDREEVRALRLSDFFQHDSNEESSSHVILEQTDLD